MSSVHLVRQIRFFMKFVEVFDDVETMPQVWVTGAGFSEDWTVINTVTEVCDLSSTQKIRVPESEHFITQSPY